MISGEASSSTEKGMPCGGEGVAHLGRPLGNEALPVAEVVEGRLRAAVLVACQRAPEQEPLRVRLVDDALHRDVPQARVVLDPDAAHVQHPLLAAGEQERQLELLEGGGEGTARDEPRTLQDAHQLVLALGQRARHHVVVEEVVLVLRVQPFLVLRVCGLLVSR